MQPSNPIEIPQLADKIVAELIAAIEKIKPDFIEGLYLTGSIPLNNFYSNKS